MYLTQYEERALNGEYGESLATAYRILVAIGEATEAERLIPVEWAHVSGVNYNTIGETGLLFLREMSNEKVKIRTTLNPMGFDPHKNFKVSEEFKNKQLDIISSYKRMGVDLTFTCIPYEVLDNLKPESYVSLAESNAAVYANSILSMRTNKESSLSALASALTGKAPYSLLRIDTMREPDTMVIVKTKLYNELDYGLLGYFAGKVSKNCVSIPYIKLDEIWKVKALSAGLGTSGSCGMFSNKEKGEKVEYDKYERESLIDELCNGSYYDTIIFGSPQLGIKDLYRLVEMVKGKRFRKRCILFCARKAYESMPLDMLGILDRAGVEIYADCCACFTPLINEGERIVTNSVKAAYYLKSWNKAKVTLKSMEEIVKEECYDS